MAALLPLTSSRIDGGLAQHCQQGVQAIVQFMHGTGIKVHTRISI